MGNDSYDKPIGNITVVRFFMSFTSYKYCFNFILKLKLHHEMLQNMGTITRFTNLDAGTLYRYKAYRVKRNSVISEPETSSWFATFEST